jgi:hypothetical protein
VRASARLVAALLVGILWIATAPTARAADGTTMTIYGHAMLDMGVNFDQIQSDWFDVMRPTKLASFDDEFGEDGSFFAGVRQSRLGIKTATPTDLGELRTTFEFELFGTGVDAGQTTFRLRHAYGELGHFGAGQTWSPFMDIDVFPNSLEYWGPNGMVFFRNVQARWMPIQGETRLTIALERPGASGDLGDYGDRVELGDVRGRFPVPDLSAEYHLGQPWGYVEVAGIVRRIEWDDFVDDAFDFSGGATGWGVNLSSNIKAGADNVLRLQAVYGEGIENYMNDAPVDIAIEPNPGDPVSPVEGVAVPVLGLVGFLDHTWNEKWSSSVGYSRLDIDNTEGQTDDSFSLGQYGLVNLLHYPAQNVMVGGELQWGNRENHDDGWSTDAIKVQFSAKYNFSHTFGGQ